MKFLNTRSLMLAAGLTAALAGPAAAQPNDLKPSDVVFLSLQAMAENPSTGRIANVGRFYERLNMDNLNEAERFALGEVYFLNFKPREAFAAYEPFMDGTDMRARIAWHRNMQIQFRAFRQFDEVERMLEAYRAKFQPIPEDVWNGGRQIFNFAEKYDREGKHQAVVDVIMAEIERLPRNAPYRAFRLPAKHLKSFDAVGRGEEARELLQAIQNEMAEQLAALTAANPGGIRMYAKPRHEEGRYYRMEEGLLGAAFSPGYPSLEMRVRHYQWLIDEIDLVL